MKILLLSALVAVALAQPLEQSQDDLAQWEMFKVEHEKEYDNEVEEEGRKKIFLDNLQFVREHNAEYDLGKKNFTVAINKFADMTGKEFAEMMNGFRIPAGYKRTGKDYVVEEGLDIPKAVDWRKKGAVTPVKDQGECGSGWAFSATGSLEGQNFLKNKKLVSLSEQNLIDCSAKEGNQGCSVGLMEFAFTYIKVNKGIDTEASYPYEAKNDKCRYKAKNKGATVVDYVDIEGGNEAKLQAAVASVGPISAIVDGNHKSFFLYKSGVYSEPDCSTYVLDQGVLVVGYGHAKKGGDYWLVKNSWTTKWGMSGYIMMSRNNHNQCGIATLASYPTV